MKLPKKLGYGLLKKLPLAVFTSLIFITNSYAEELVGYGGVYTSGKTVTEQTFANFDRNKIKISQKIRQTLELLNEENKLPFKILFETDSEEIKQKLLDTYSLAVVITRDDIKTEKFESEDKSLVLNKSFINVGMVVILYQTTDDSKEIDKKKNSIIFSFPLVGYAMNITGSKTMSQEEIDKTFVDVAGKTFEEELVKKLEKISLGKITGTIKNIHDNKAQIDIGSSNGLVKGQRVKILANEKTLGKGKVETITNNEAVVSFDDQNFHPKENMKVETINIKGLSDDTYQVVDFKISSNKCKKFFDENTIGLQASQWFSDFLSERGGKVVLPSKVGNNWVESSNEQSFAVFMKDGQEYLFEVAKPKYQVKLDLTGLSDKLLKDESNNINENWIFKLWLKVEIPEKTFSKEFDIVTTKTLIKGTQTFEEKNEVFDLLHQLTAKTAKELE